MFYFICPNSWGCKIISFAMNFRRSISLSSKILESWYRPQEWGIQPAWGSNFSTRCRTRNIPMISRNHQQRRGMVYCPTFFPIAGWFSGISPGELWHLFTVIIGSFDPRGIEEWWVWVATPLLCIFSKGMSSRASGYSSGSVHIHRYSLHETRKFAGLSSKCLQTAGYIPACPHSIYSHS